MVDLETSSRADERQKSPKRLVLAVLLVAALAVVAIVLVAIRDEEPAAPVAQPAPIALFGTPDEEFAPGTYYVNDVDGAATPKIFITLGEGWSNSSDGWSIVKEGTGNVTFSRPDRVFLDACNATEGLHGAPVYTLNGLTSALTEQRGWAEVTDPSDITIDGYPGKTFQRTAPADFTDCTNGGTARFKSWENDLPDGDLGWSFYETDEVETLRVLDLNGTIVIVNTRLKPDHLASAQAELAAVLDSISIQHPPDGKTFLAYGAAVDFVGRDGLGGQALDISAAEEDGEVTGEVQFQPSGLGVTLDCANTDTDRVVILGGQVTTDDPGGQATMGELLAIIIREGPIDSVALIRNDNDAGSCTELLEAIPQDALTDDSNFTERQLGDDIETG